MDPSTSDVHIAIVTALAVESAAVRTLVGDLTDMPAPGDPHHYLAGWVPAKDPGRQHRVVLALQAQDGTRNAAATCTNLIRSFPDLHCVILCGIAGGVPAPAHPDRHVRLGDIVVATAGVIDYGHVRTVNGTDALRRQVDGLSPVLLRADRELQVKEQRGSLPWRTWLANADRPADSIAKPVVDLSGGSSHHWPRVHRGAIASADRLVRDTALRDGLADRYGIRAIEMEAAGLAVAANLHSTHWFVVRGVADHCDDRKNDVWHPYASLAAAAYVRALLAECPSFDTAYGPHRAPYPDRTARRDYRGDLAKVIDALLYIPQLRDDYQRRAVMSLLPDRIRTMVADNVNGRLHVLAMVQACVNAEDGRERLLDALRLALPPDSTDLRRAETTIRDHWPHRLRNDLEATGS